MIKMKSGKKIITTAGVTFAIIGVLLAVVVYPIYKGVVNDNAEVVKLKQELLQINENRKQLRDFENISLQYEEEFLQVQKRFVDSETPVSFFRFLDQAAQTFGLRIEKSPSNPIQIEGDRWPSLEVRIAGEGLYSNFLAFLQAIENAPYILEVQTISINKSEQEQTKEQIEFTLSLKVFVR
jgi:hypothetical protein